MRAKSNTPFQKDGIWYKVCPACGLEKSEDDYFIRSNGVLYSYCKMCVSQKNKLVGDKQRKHSEWYYKNRIERLEYKRKWREENKDRINSSRRVLISKRDIENSDVPSGYKRCSRCRVIKSADRGSFYSGPVDGLSSWCKMCANESSKNWASSHREVVTRITRNSQYRKLYGITLEDYEDLIKQQGGVCAICKQVPRPNSRGVTFHVDHEHILGYRRGLICGNHNHMLGSSGDNPEILRAGADYIEFHRKKYMEQQNNLIDFPKQEGGNNV